MEQSIPDQTRKYTEEQYLRINAASDIKYEFRNGQLIPFGGWERDENGRIIGRAGGTPAHAYISVNLARAIGNRLEGTGCRVGNSDLAVRVNRTGGYCYPDVSVACEPVAFDSPGSQLALVNPQVIIEVTSKSTANDDRGEKLTDYISIDSLREYVLFTQDRARADTFYRQHDGVWAIGPWTMGLEGAVTFRSLNITIPMAEIYAGIDFAAVEIKAR